MTQTESKALEKSIKVQLIFSAFDVLKVLLYCLGQIYDQRLNKPVGNLPDFLSKYQDLPKMCLTGYLIPR